MSNPRVLLIEHDAALQTILIDIFTHAGYRVCAAVTLDDMRAMVPWFQPEVVVIAGGMRGAFAAGWQAAQTITSLDPTLPLVMLTTNRAALAEVGRTERGRLFAAGLLKPFVLDELLATVARCRRAVQPTPAPAEVPAEQTLPQPPPSRP